MVKSWREACGLHTGTDTDTKQPLVSECKIKVKESSAEISLSVSSKQESNICDRKSFQETW
jgi:hypothetical protein